MPLPPYLIIKAGSAFPHIVKHMGDFEDWTISGMDVENSKVRVIRAFDDYELPAVKDVKGIIITGSHAMVTDREPWSERLAEWIRQAVSMEIPLLGICYGHQLLAHALGGRVGNLSDGREFGTVEVHLTPEGKEDRLLGILPDKFSAHAAHSQSVVSLPPAARLLAENSYEPHHAFSVGSSCWGVQFHPEFDARAMRAYIRAMAEELDSEGIHTQKLESEVRECPIGDQLLRRFVALSQEGS